MISYKDAGENAPPEVKAAISRYHEEGRNEILLYWLLGSGTPPYKVSQSDSDYRDYPKNGQKCANCEFAYSKLYRQYDEKVSEKYGPRYICSQIKDPIDPEGWCVFWKKGRLI